MSKRGRGRSKSINEDDDLEEESKPKKGTKKQKIGESTGGEVTEKNFLKFYSGLPPKDHDLVRFFCRKDMFTVYDDDASSIAEEYFKTSRAVKKWKDKGPKYLDLKPNQFQDVCRTLLLEKRNRVEVYSNESGKWELSKQASPGNVSQLEDVLYGEEEMRDSQIMMAVFISNIGGQRTIGLSYVDVTLKFIGTTQFDDNEQLSNLESALFQIGGKECFCMPLDPKDKESQRLHSILNHMQIKITVKKKSDFKALDTIEQDLHRLLGKKYWNSISELEQKAAMASLSALIVGMDLLALDKLEEESFELKKFVVNEFVRLDSAAISALNVLPNPREPNQKQNLYGLLNKCKTTMGARLLMQWLKQPLKSLDAIQRRLDLVEIFYSEETLTKELRGQCLRRIPDLERLAKKLQAGRAGLHEAVNIYQFVQSLPQFVETLQACVHSNSNLLHNNFTKKFETLKTEFKPFEDLVEETVDLAGITKGEYHVNPSYDDALQKLSVAKRNLLNQIGQHEEDVKQLLKDPPSFKMEQDKANGFYFRVTRKDESKIDGKKKPFTIIHSSKVIKFRDGKLEKLSDEYFELNKQYEVQSQELVKEIMKIAASYMPVLEESHNLIAEIDVLSTLASVTFSAPFPYVKPTVTAMGEGELILKQARHPILEWQPDTTFIPNDAILRKGESSFQIITGPNMGGKSTFIRSVGVIVLLAQMGCYVPCTEATVPICDAILARVGASDSQLRGVSTFMAEMLETANILNTATENSLIIIDELGRGTSTYDGFGLAWAISEWICTKISAFCLFATHFHELTQLQEEISCVKNFHVAAEPDEAGHGLTLLYEIQPGPSDQSFGIHVAKIANFPQEVIEVAKAKAKELEAFDTKNALKTQLLEEETSEEPSVTEGKKLMREILQEFANMPLDTLSDEQIGNFINSMKDKVTTAANPYLVELLTAGSDGTQTTEQMEVEEDQ